MSHGKGRLEGYQAEIFLGALMALTRRILHQPRTRRSGGQRFSFSCEFSYPFSVEISGICALVHSPKLDLLLCGE